MLSILVPATLLLALVSAKTSLQGCTSTTTVVNGASGVLYYDPSNGEICSILDCGGGRAPPKTTVPGCGSLPYTPEYISGYAQNTAHATSSSTFTPAPILSFDSTKGMYVSPSSTASAVTSTSASASKATITGAPSGSVTGSASASGASESASPSSTAAQGAGNGLGRAGGLVGAVAGIVGLAVL